MYNQAGKGDKWVAYKGDDYRSNYDSIFRKESPKRTALEILQDNYDVAVSDRDWQLADTINRQIKSEILNLKSETENENPLPETTRVG